MIGQRLQRQQLPVSLQCWLDTLEQDREDYQIATPANFEAWLTNKTDLSVSFDTDYFDHLSAIEAFPETLWLYSLRTTGRRVTAQMKTTIDVPRTCHAPTPVCHAPTGKKMLNINIHI